MPLYAKMLLPLVLLALATGCQVYQQASTALDQVIEPKHLETIDISAWPPLNLALFPSAKGHTGEVLAIEQISESPLQLVSVGSDGRVIGWDLNSGSGHLLKTLEAPLQFATVGERAPLIAYATKGRLVVTCLIECQGEWSLSRLKTRPASLEFHDLDNSVLIGGGDGRVYRWNFALEGSATTVTEREKILERYIAHQSPISALASHSVGRAFFSADWSGALYSWLPYTADDHGGEYDKNLFGGRFYGEIGTFLKAPRGQDRGITALGLSANGERLGLGSEDGYVEVWEVRGFLMGARQPAHNGRVTSVAVSHDGQRVASLGRDSMLFVHAVAPDPMHRIAPEALPLTLEPILSQPMAGARHLRFISNGNIIFTTADGRLGEISLKDLKDTTSALRKTTPTPTPTPTRAPTAIDSDY